MNSLDKIAALCAEKGIIFLRDESLRERCTFRIGGTAALFTEPGNEDGIAAVTSACAQNGVELVVLGNGSNVLVSDAGYPGVVLHLGKRFAKMRLIDETTIECESGAPLKALCEFACNNGLSGLEFAYGIPGSVGGAIYMNAGAYGGEIKDILVEAAHISPAGEHGAFSGSALALSYRHSVYSGSDLIITRGIFRLNKGEKDEIRAKMDDFLRRRREKQPLNYPSAGSTFKRPPGGYASELIDRCGLKGKSVGGAAVSDKHAGFVVNTGGATCSDVLALIETVKLEVFKQTGIPLECEVKVIGKA